MAEHHELPKAPATELILFKDGRPSRSPPHRQRYLPRLRAEAEVAARLGIRARFEPAGDLPCPARGRLAFAEQAEINPYLFLRGLARRLESRARLHERTGSLP